MSTHHAPLKFTLTAQISVFVYSQMRYIKFIINWRVIFIIYLEITRRKDNGGLNHPLEIDSKEDQKLPVLRP